MRICVPLLPIPPVFNGAVMKRHQQIGLSLVELMIAMALGLVLMGGVIQVFLSSRTVFSSQQAISRVQESGRLAVDFISADARMAGYMGCLDRTLLPEVAITTPSAFWDNYQESIRGYKSSGLPAGLNLVPAPSANTDVLVVRSARGAMHYLAEPNAVNSLKVIAGSSNGITIKNDQAVVASNCVGARIFKVATANTNTGVITHTGGWGGGGSFSPTENFDAGAEVIPVLTTLYYIAENPFGRPALYQKNGSVDAAVEIIEGVENMALSFGRDSNADGVIDTYANIDGIAATQWPTVGSVRIELLVQSNEENVVEDVQSYSFRGEVVPGPDDKRLRQVFSSLVTIRGRVD